MSLQNINSYTYSPGFSQGDQYHNAILCISGNVQSIYLDGVLVGSTTTASNILSYYPTINQILLGCAGDKSNGFTGYLDDFRMYSYAFNPSQVSNLYSNRNVVAYYPFDSCFNNVENNIVTTGNNTTLSYDATLVGNASISNSTYQVGTGSLNLTNTAGTASTTYINSTCGFAPNATTGLSISLWFKTDGISGRKMRLFDLCPAIGNQGIFVDISGTNIINTLSNSYTLPSSTSTTTTTTTTTTNANLLTYLPLTANTTDIGTNPQTVNTSGSITYTTIAGKQCAHFNNPTGLANRLYFNFTNSSKFTLSYWVYIVGSAAPDFTACSILNPNFVITTGVLSDYYVNNTMDVYAALPTEWINTANSSNNCPYGQWNHIVYSVDQTSYVTTLYINGTFIKSITGTGAFPGSSFILTLGCYGNSRGFNGYICQFQYYDIILSSTQITNLFNTNSITAPTTTTTGPTVNITSIINTYSNYYLWLDAATSSDITLSSGNNITAWLGHNNGLGTSSIAATYNTNPYYVYTNPSTQNFESSYKSTSVSETIFFVVSFPNITTTSSKSVYLVAADGGANSRCIELNTNFIFITKTDTGAGIQGNFPQTLSNITDNTKYLISISVNYMSSPSSTAVMRINGNSLTIVNMNAAFSQSNSAKASRFGYIYGQYYSRPNINYHEIIGIGNSGVMSISDIQKIEGYLAWKWGLQTSLPNTHTFYASAPAS